MNDYWNDPPDYPEAPECCDEMMEVLDDGTCKCNKCGKVNCIDCDPEPIFEEADPESYLLDFNELCQTCGKASSNAIYCCAACSPQCVHGNTSGDCGACDHAADLAYDAAREGRGNR